MLQNQKWNESNETKGGEEGSQFSLKEQINQTRERLCGCVLFIFLSFC
jgi:hypothetical protein